MHKTYVWYEQLGYMAVAYIVVADNEEEAREILKNNMGDDYYETATNEFKDLKVLDVGEFLFVE